LRLTGNPSRQWPQSDGLHRRGGLRWWVGVGDPCRRRSADR